MAIWTVSTYYKKSCQEVEHWVRKNGPGRLTTTNGFRFGEWTVETTDDNPPEFEFTEVPNGDGRRDSLDMCNLEGNNIESSELMEMFDGGCWFDTEFEDVTEEERAELEDFIEENSVYDLEDREDDPWYPDETEWWIWGPIEIKNEAGDRVRIICADEDGNVVDFKDQE